MHMNNLDLSTLTAEERQELLEILSDPQAFCEAFFIYPSGPMEGRPFRANFPQQKIFQSDKLTTWICVHRRAGKMQPLYSTVYTPEGPRTMGSLQLGDVVSTPDGGTGKVKAIYPHGEQTIFRMYLDDGTYVDSGAEHLWEVYTENGWKGKQGEHRKQYTNKVLTTLQIEEGLTYKYAGREEFQFKLNPIKAVEFKQAENLPIEPYTLGVLLGDGHMPTRAITSMDEQIIDTVRTRSGFTVKEDSKRKGKAGRFVIQSLPFRETLRELNLLNTGSHTKFIPQQYLHSSIENRLWLLRGLMDTDGGRARITDENGRGLGQIEYCTVSSQLAQDVAYLARSLGCKVTVSESICGYRLKTGERKITGTRFRLRIRPTTEFELFNLDRKKCGALPDRYRRRTIVRVERLGQTEMQCIEIDHPDHLYITDNYTPTHNSYSMTLLALYFAMTREKKQILVFSPSQPQILEFFRILDEWIDNSPALSSMIDKSKPNRDSPYPQRSFLTGSSIVGHITGLKEGTQQGKRGLTADIVLLDEAQEFSLSDWRVVQAIIGGDFTRLGTVQTYIAGTVREPEGHFYEKVKQIIELEDNEVLIHMPITENLDYTAEMIAVLRAATTEAVWRTEYMLEVGEGENTVFRIGDVDRACVCGTSRVLNPHTLRPTPIKLLPAEFHTPVFNFQRNALELAECRTIEAGIRPCTRITTHTGRVHRISDDHEFFVHGRGWSEACTLRPGEKILAVDSYPNWGCNTIVEDQANELAINTLHHAHVPDSIFLLDRDSLCLYISCVWKHTGRVFERLNTMGFMLGSEALSADLQHLLQRVGVESRVNHDLNLFVDDVLDQRMLLHLVGVPCEVYDVRSARRWEIVVDAHSIGDHPTYDLSVKHFDHNFLISDTVVHNCTWDWELGSQWIDCNPITHQALLQPRFIGIDWDKSGAGSQIVVVQYDVPTQVVYTIDQYEIPRGDFTYTEGSNKTLELVHIYDPLLIVSDGGAGEMQWEYLYLESVKRHSPYAERFEKKYFKSNVIVQNPQTGEEEKKMMKTMMVGFMQKKLQEGKWYFPTHLRILEEQLKIYQAKISRTGNVEYFSKKDHIIDAHIFAFWGIWSLFEDPLSTSDALSTYYREVSAVEQSALLGKRGANQDSQLWGDRGPGYPLRTDLEPLHLNREMEDRRLYMSDMRGDLYGF